VLADPIKAPSRHFSLSFLLSYFSVIFSSLPYLVISSSPNTLSHSTKKAELVMGVMVASHSHSSTLHRSEITHHLRFPSNS